MVGWYGWWRDERIFEQSGRYRVRGSLFPPAFVPGNPSTWGQPPQRAGCHVEGLLDKRWNKDTVSDIYTLPTLTSPDPTLNIYTPPSSKTLSR